MPDVDAPYRWGVSRVRPETDRCPECDGPMAIVIIDGHESHACPVDGYAYAVDQDEDGSDG